MFVGASVLAAQSTNMAIVALEGDKEIYEKLLLPFQLAASELRGVDPTHMLTLMTLTIPSLNKVQLIYVSKSFILLSCIFCIRCIYWNLSNYQNLSFVAAI